jgi:formylglycine-generating enzyme required for sulfatase activity
LILYYSWSPNGNTEKVARIIQTSTNGDIIKVEPTTPFPDLEYRPFADWAKEQQEKKNYPAIKPLGVNIADYDFIFIGTPTWWGTLALPIVTLLQQTDFKGKPVKIFGTHQGGAAKVMSDFTALARNATIVRGELFGNVATDSGIEGNVTQWVQRLRLTLSGQNNNAPVPTDFVRIQGGTFTMGSPSSEKNRNDNETPHKVRVDAFYMGRTEVTQKEWIAVMGSNPSNFKGDKLPVENVSWNDVIAYCNALSLKEGLTPAYTVNGEQVTWNRAANGYRLPTVAEWEYACRAGSSSPFNTGNNITTNQANYNGNYPYNSNTKGSFRETTTAVGSFAPNSWGLYDMHGNVYEWCWDWLGSYGSGSQENPAGASSGTLRIGRGGGWFSQARYMRSAYRYYFTTSFTYNDLGFRLVRQYAD